MPRRSTSLSNVAGSAITREIDSKYDVIKEVSQHLDEIAQILEMDLTTLLAELQEAANFEGLTVEAGETAEWDAVNKVITVPTIAGEDGTDGEDGKDLTVSGISYNASSGEFTWTFSDDTTYVTPDLRGEKGETGETGPQGEKGNTGERGPTGYAPVVDMWVDDEGNLIFDTVGYESVEG